MKQKLKPCPFCGSSMICIESSRAGSWIVCDLCGASSRMRDAPETVLALWNRQAACWSLIASAPKQEPVIFGNYNKKGWLCIGYVNALGEVIAGYSGESKPEFSPTHWMPFPAPPKEPENCRQPIPLNALAGS